MTADRELVFDVARAIAGDVCIQVEELIDVLEGNDEKLSELARALLASAEDAYDQILGIE